MFWKGMETLDDRKTWKWSLLSGSDKGGRKELLRIAPWPPRECCAYVHICILVKYIHMKNLAKNSVLIGSCTLLSNKPVFLEYRFISLETSSQWFLEDKSYSQQKWKHSSRSVKSSRNSPRLSLGEKKQNIDTRINTFPIILKLLLVTHGRVLSFMMQCVQDSTSSQYGGALPEI